MRAVAGHLALSPWDLNGYVECAHLTTLAVEVARGERTRPHVADEHAELLRRKGEGLGAQPLDDTSRNPASARNRKRRSYAG